MKISYKREKASVEDGMIPTKFKHTIDKKKKRLNDISPQAKVVAALTKCLAAQTAKDGIGYYVNGDTMYCPNVSVSEGSPTKKGEYPKRSYSAKGRFKMGKTLKDGASFSVVQFDIKFRDSTDEMGLPDLVIESAEMTEMRKGTPLNE